MDLEENEIEKKIQCWAGLGKTSLIYFQSLDNILCWPLKNLEATTGFQECDPDGRVTSLGHQVSLITSYQPCTASKPECMLFACLSLTIPFRSSGTWVSDC